MDLYLYLLIIFLAIAYLLLKNIINRRRGLRKLLETRSLGSSSFSLEDLDTHYKERLGQIEKRAVDSLSWNDLEMDDFLLKNQSFFSSPGACHVYESFHYLEDEKALEARKRLSNLSEEDRLTASRHLFYLGRDRGVNLPFFIREAGSLPLSYLLLNSLFILALVAILVTFLSRGWGLIFLGILIMINSLIYTSSKEKIAKELYNLDYFQRMIKRARLLVKELSQEQESYKEELDERLQAFKRLRIRPLTSEGGSLEMQFARDSFNIIFLSSLRHYIKTVKLLARSRDEASRIMELIGELELGLFVARLRENKTMCQADFSPSRSLSFKDLYHPALEEPVPATRQDSRRLLVTGSNASGKSTFMKSMALGVLFSQVTGYAFADEFSLSPGYLYTSMALRDSLEKRESYFVTEIKSLKRIVEATEKDFCYCFIDEILRGTNTLERIASSSTVLKNLAKSDSCIYVASHDIELTELLSGYENVHFREHFKEEDLVFDYRLLEGPSDTTNAIDLLRILGFDEKIIREARDKVEYFVENRSWKE